MRVLGALLALAACGGESPAAPDAGDAGDPGDAGDAAATDAGPEGGPAVVVPAETADDEALADLAGWMALPVFRDGLYRQQSSTARPDTPPVPGYPLLDNGNRDMNHFVCASEDAEERPPAVVETLLDLAACPEPWVRGFVLARFEGSGRLARIWMTALSIRSAPPDREVLRIYVDDEVEPLVEVPLATALDGSAGEIFAPPFGAGAATFLAWYYPVVFGERLVVTLDRLGPADLYYHHVDAVLDATPRPRAAAAARLPARDTARALLDGALPTGEVTRATVTLAPGERATALDLAGPAVIVALRADVADADLAALDAARIEIVWGDDAAPAIALPLAELFAAALDPPTSSSLALQARRAAGRLVLGLRLPMPFASRARITIGNEGAAPIDLVLEAESIATELAGAHGRLHAVGSETVAPASGPHPLATAAGPGRVAGVCLMMEGHAFEDGGDRLAFLEGDERFILDGEPAVIGTGTEDYLNGAFYFAEGERATPFAQVWGVDGGGPIGRTTACRWHVLGDAIDFASSLEMELEIGPGRPDLLDRYRSVVFLYR